jgi:hypothetical protein
VVFVNLMAFSESGMAGVKGCWQMVGFGTFGVIGLWYAFGDFLEMLSMGALSGGVYQILLQSKLLITAVMMKQIKGTDQSGVQWQVLIATTLAMSAFVIVDAGVVALWWPKSSFRAMPPYCRTPNSRDLQISRRLLSFLKCLWPA